MRRALILSLLAFPLVVQAQIFGPRPELSAPFIQNSISNMAAFGDTLWVGPSLNRIIGYGDTWYLAESADSVVNGEGRLFSIALARDTVVAGLGFSKPLNEGTVQTAMGFYISVDGGDIWRFVSPPLDARDADTLRYGGQDVPALPIVVPEQSPPYNVAFKGNVLFTASWASGIRRSRDFGLSWDRILLPPTELDSLTPTQTIDFYFDPRVPQSGSPNIPKYRNGWQNFLGFSVMIDSQGRVWAGTAGGVNVSDNALTAPADQIRWRHFRAGSASNQMLGNWVIRMREQPSTGDIWLTNWITAAGESQGIVSTSDGGRTFTRHLEGERINDIGFEGNTIYAAGEFDLFISHDNGQTWEQQTGIRSESARLKSDASFRAVAVASDRVYIGTSDGLLSTPDNGRSWNIQRVDFPLRGGNVFTGDDSRNVSVYAYPNPFSRTQHEVVRIRFEADAGDDIHVRLFDFGMNPIRTIHATAQSRPVTDGVYETEWDGLDSAGRRVANGPVFYRVEVGGRVLDGKLLVLD
jgi:hypothetical protein